MHRTRDRFNVCIVHLFSSLAAHTHFGLFDCVSIEWLNVSCKKSASKKCACRGIFIYLQRVKKSNLIDRLTLAVGHRSESGHLKCKQAHRQQMLLQLICYAMVLLIDEQPVVVACQSTRHAETSFLFVKFFLESNNNKSKHPFSYIPSRKKVSSQKNQCASNQAVNTVLPKIQKKERFPPSRRPSIKSYSSSPQASKNLSHSTHTHTPNQPTYLSKPNQHHRVFHECHCSSFLYLNTQHTKKNK